jgi:hypothetical protein
MPNPHNEAPESCRSAAYSLPIPSYSVGTSMSFNQLPSYGDGQAPQYVDNPASIGSEAAIAKLIDGTLEKVKTTCFRPFAQLDETNATVFSQDPSYRPPSEIYNQLLPKSTDLSLKYFMTTSLDLRQRSPGIRSASPSTLNEPPLYQYYRRDPYEEVTEEAPLPFHQGGFYGLQKPPHPQQALKNTRTLDQNASKGAQSGLHHPDVSAAPAKTVSSATPNKRLLLHPLMLRSYSLMILRASNVALLVSIVARYVVDVDRKLWMLTGEVYECDSWRAMHALHEPAHSTPDVAQELQRIARLHHGDLVL